MREVKCANLDQLEYAGVCFVSAHLLQCGETSQLVQHYVVLCCDCSQSGGGRQEEEMGQTAGVVGLLLLLFPLLLFH